MRQITLSQETIDDIKDFMDGYKLEDELVTTIHDVCFSQKEADIFVDFNFYGHIEEDVLVHTEVSYPNVEDLSRIVTDNAEVVHVEAYDDDGEEVSITNEDVLYDL